MRSYTSYIGIDLGGGKGKSTAVAHLRAVTPSVLDAGSDARVEVVDYGTGKDMPWYDDRLVAYLLDHPDALVAIDAPLSLPAGVRCDQPGCETDDEPPILRWFRERADAQPRGRKPRYTPYTQRATEVLLQEELKIMPREALGQGMGPLTARAVYLRRALRGHFTVGENLIEVYPKASLMQLLPHELVDQYKRSASSPNARLKILNLLTELRFAPGQWRHDALENDHKFDAIICAYTAYLYARGACKPPPDEVVATDGWIWVPESST